MPLLDVDDLHVSYGELDILRGISFTINPGEIVTILGSNGAGKTTMLKTIAGLITPARGAITFRGEDITRTPAYRIACKGLSLVPEGRQLFPEHTVRENLELGAYWRLRTERRADYEESLSTVLQLFPRIGERLDQPAGLLSGGEQQMVAIARALVARPQLLLLDEPSLGLAPLVLDAIFGAFKKLKERGLTLLVVEQIAWLALHVCDRAYVLESGRVALAGTPAELLANPKVIEVYLGTATAD